MTADNSLRVNLRLYRTEDTELVEFLDALPKKDRARRIRTLLRKAVYAELAGQWLTPQNHKSRTPYPEADMPLAPVTDRDCSSRLKAEALRRTG